MTELPFEEQLQQAKLERSGKQRWSDWPARELEREPAVRLPISTRAVLGKDLTAIELQSLQQKYVDLGPLKRSADFKTETGVLRYQVARVEND